MQLSIFILQCLHLFLKRAHVGLAGHVGGAPARQDEGQNVQTHEERTEPYSSENRNPGRRASRKRRGCDEGEVAAGDATVAAVRVEARRVAGGA